jgi:MoxR-like ATPase
LPAPFLVLATQNPLEQEGTYPLPEAQIDRFMMKVIVDYPTRAEERAILDTMATTEPTIVPRTVVSASQILDARHVVNILFVDDKVRDYIVDIVLATRPPITAGLDLNGYVQNGASPRATIALTLAARAMAFLNGRHFVTPQDVKTVAMDVLRHRVSVTYEAEAENVTSKDVVERILNTLPVP